MKIHEYQAKEVLKAFGIPVPAGRVARTPEEARSAAEAAGGEVVVKAQVHAGGRGKGGGIRKATTPAEASAAAKAILGTRLVTPQTGAEGKLVRSVLVERSSAVAAEYYAGVALDRETSRVTLIASPAGGMEIETVARETPDQIIRQTVDPVLGMQPFQGRRLAASLGLSGKAAGAAAKVFAGLYAAFTEKDASLVEVNPLVRTRDGEILALDAKINFDDSALFRHPDVAALRDPDEEDPREREAVERNFSWVSLDGDIGCLVNGAGLAMATMDIIRHEGGMPANFLDVGGGADAEQVKAAFRLILADPKVKAILVNIFGGIMKCDVIATGVVAAARETGLKVPLVVRLEGTNVKEGKSILEKSGLS
ncbi:MAG: ADP-forming succinate--CoA ligase subunit beta, partial [Planctomycetes bacterium]|nr:ADP-forming succinate--CoA ligase subunit beta [Planctomycetota bacterium]